jgi:hypothetical protein
MELGLIKIYGIKKRGSPHLKYPRSPIIIPRKSSIKTPSRIKRFNPNINILNRALSEQKSNHQKETVN